jgi:hypothetical protein
MDPIASFLKTKYKTLTHGTKFCKDCLFYKGKQCVHESNISVDLVSGEMIFNQTPQNMRKPNAACAPVGKLFKEIP